MHTFQKKPTTRVYLHETTGACISCDQNHMKQYLKNTSARVRFNESELKNE